jgi:hypothetical protein
VALSARTSKLKLFQILDISLSLGTWCFWNFRNNKG